jgi:peroxiredoxin
LIFFHTECRYCKADIPLWKKLSQNAVERKIDIVAITLEVDTETVSRFSQEHQFGFPILIDRGGRVFDLLGIAATPSKVLLSEDMKVVNMWRGLVSQSARPADIISLSAVFGVANDDLPILPGD